MLIISDFMGCSTDFIRLLWIKRRISNLYCSNTLLGFEKMAPKKKLVPASIHKKKETEKLVGKALLTKVKELSSSTVTEKAKECGYYTTSKNGKVRINLTGFYAATLQANGLLLKNRDNSSEGRGRDATYQVTVHQNGQIVIGSTYTKKLGLKHGDEFKIKVGYKHIYLEKIGK